MNKELYTLPALLFVGSLVLAAGCPPAKAILTDAAAITDDSLSGIPAVPGALAVSPVMSARASE